VNFGLLLFRSFFLLERRLSSPSLAAPVKSPARATVPVPTRLMDSTPVPQPSISTFKPLVFGSPMPIVEAPIISSAGVTEADAQVLCLSTEDGGFGSTNGDQVQLPFFYQVEAAPGTTETQMNGAILGDIEITLLDFMIPVFFSDCRTPTPASGTAENPGSYPGEFVGLSSKPADFVLRGCEFHWTVFFAMNPQI
jgi:hypothetical protein